MPFAQQIADDTSNKTMVQMIQAFAHDIRKPFSMFRATLEVIQNVDNIDEIKLTSSEFIPEITKAMHDVNTLLSNVIEFSCPQPQQLTETEPESLIENAISEVANIPVNKSVDLEFKFEHNHNVLVDSFKIHRVIVSLIQNALSHMIPN